MSGNLKKNKNKIKSENVTKNAFIIFALLSDVEMKTEKYIKNKQRFSRLLLLLLMLFVQFEFSIVEVSHKLGSCFI